MFDHRMSLMWDVVLGDCAWDDAMRAFSSDTGGATSVVFISNHAGTRAGQVDLWSHRLDRSTFGAKDVSSMIDPKRDPIARNILLAAPAISYDRRALLSDRDFENHPACSTLRRQDVFHGRIAPLVVSPTVYAGAWIGMPKAWEKVNERSAAAFDAWLPPIRRAVRTLSMIGNRSSDPGTLPQDPAEDGLGVVTVTAGLRILGANEEGTRILAARDGIESNRGELAIFGADDELRRRLKKLWATQSESLATSLRVERVSGLPAYGVDIIPSRSAGAAARVLIFDPASEANLPEAARIMARFGLTPAEARVARLTPLALGTAGVAGRLGLSENTVKTHLTAIRSKLGARNTTEIALTMRRI
jgi:DNA-binding CsgD family transcriptional regulator